MCSGCVRAGTGTCGAIRRTDDNLCSERLKVDDGDSASSGGGATSNFIYSIYHSARIYRAYGNSN